MSPKAAAALRRLREEAWLGDAVLELVAREWILARLGRLDAAAQTAVTSNQMLSTLGNPTAVEAEIGRLYQSKGLETARQWVLEKLGPALERAVQPASARPGKKR